jgi:hypothetical protein
MKRVAVTSRAKGSVRVDVVVIQDFGVCMDQEGGQAVFFDWTQAKRLRDLLAKEVK